MSLSCVLLFATVLTVACRPDTSHPTATPAKVPPAPFFTAPEIVFESATLLRIDGAPCQLLGIVESNDVATRQQALDFASRWLESVGKFGEVLNNHEPRRLDDGSRLVWMCGHNPSLSCLNEELVRAGLVIVDYSQWRDYNFTVLAKDGRFTWDWRAQLDKAELDCDRAVKPSVPFAWPPADEERQPLKESADGGA